MKNARLWIRRVHLTLALSMGLFLSVLGLSGSVLVFGDEIDRWLRPELRTVSVPNSAEPVELDAAVAAARDAVPGARPLYLNFPTREDGSYLFWLYADDGHFTKAYVDPYTASVLGHTSEHAGFVGFMHDLHIHLLLGDNGVTVVGILGLGLFVLMATGLYLWWPGWGRVRTALGVKWSASLRRRIYDLHRAAGAWATPLLALTAVTGASLAFYTWVAPALVDWFGGELPADTLALDEPVEGPTSWQSVLEAAQATFPEADPRWFYFPPSPDRSASVQMRHPTNANPHGDSFVYIHPEHAQQLAAYDWRSATPGETMVDLLYPLHIGTFGPSLLMRILMLIVGLLPTFLLATGVYLFWTRHRARRRTASPRAVQTAKTLAQPQRAAG